MLNLENITIRFNARSHPVLADVSLRVDRGRRTVLLGANGSGKSSLMLCALGFLNPVSGTVAIDGLDPFAADRTRDARRLVGFVGQHPDDGIVATSVEDEVAFGLENLGLPREEIRVRVDAALASVGLGQCARREPHTLSGGQKQRLVMAGALALDPRYLLLDEPCSMLDAAAREHMLGLIEEATESGIGVLHITHDLSEAAHADEIVVLHAGAVVYCGDYAGLLERSDEFSTWGIELGLPAVRRIPAVDVTREMFRLAEVSVTFEADSDNTVAALSEVNATVKKGEFIVIEGATGAGKSTLLKVLAGLLGVDTGEILFSGKPLTAKQARGRIGLVFQNPEMSLFGETVERDIAFGPENFGATRAEALIKAHDTLCEVGLDPAVFAQRSPFTLSGGEARKVALAGVLSFAPEVILADEPTAELDAHGRLQIRELFARESARATIIVVTHNLPEFSSLADRVFRIEDGRLREIEVTA